MGLEYFLKPWSDYSIILLISKKKIDDRHYLYSLSNENLITKGIIYISVSLGNKIVVISVSFLFCCWL